VAWLLFAGLVILSLFGAYSMVVEHAKNMAALETRVSWAEARVKLLTKSVKGKNAYIKRLETRMVENASADTIVDMLNNAFMHEDEDGVSEPAVPSVGSPDEA